MRIGGSINIAQLPVALNSFDDRFLLLPPNDNNKSKWESAWPLFSHPLYLPERGILTRKFSHDKTLEVNQ